MSVPRLPQSLPLADVAEFDYARSNRTRDAHNGYITRDGVDLCIYRLEHTKWSLEVVDAEGTSTVWDDEFET